MTNKKIFSIIIFILLVCNIFLGIKYFSNLKELRHTNSLLTIQTTNNKVLEFSKLFIQKVLKAETEVDFDTRLKLENTVRNLDDEEILSQWKKFVDSKTEARAQIEAKNLLELLINKINLW